MQLNRSEIPYNHSGINLKIPEIEQNSFGSMKFYKYQDNSQPLVNFKINFKNGASADKIPGQANYTMTMLQSGTTTKNATEISEQFEQFGATYFFNAYWDECAAGFTCLEQYFEPCFKTLADCILNPVFDDSEISRQRDRISAGIMQNSADPGYMAQIAFNKGIFGTHPYSNPRTGFLSNVAQIIKDDLIEFYNLIINKSEVSIIITGNFDNNSVNELISQHFTRFQNNKQEVIIPEYHFAGLVNVIAEKDDAMQTNLRIGKPGINRKNPDYPAFQVINTIFGGYFLSRLNHVLRETKGLTYGIHSYLDMRKFADTFIISTSINADKTTESIQDILDISLSMSESKLDRIEIERSIEYMTGSFARSLETPKQITGIIQTLDSFDLQPSFLSNFYAQLRKLSAEEIFEVQKKYFSMSDYMISATGDVEFLKSALTPFGEYKILEFS